MTVKRGYVETFFKRLEAARDAEKEKLTNRFKLEEKQIKEALELMDKRVQKLVGCRTEKKATTRYVYKKLELVGETEEYFKDSYFESISEVDFNSTADKNT